MAKVLINNPTVDKSSAFKVRDNSGVIELSMDGGTTWVSENQISALALATSFISVTDTDAYTVDAANSGKTHVVPDLTADCVFSLPTAAAGLHYRFVYGGNAADAHDWQFDTGSDTNFYIGGLVQHDPDDAGDDTVVYHPDGDSNSKANVLTPDSGTVVELYCDGTNWLLSGTVISATDTAVTWADQ